MERKYYLRGLGLGIAVTAVSMGIALSGNRSMTNEEIIARAKELGLVENTVLSDTEAGQEDVADDERQDVADQPQDVARAERSDPDLTETDSGAEDDETEDSPADTNSNAEETEQENDSETDSSGQEDNAEMSPAFGEVAGGEVQDDVTNFTADDAEVGDDNETNEAVTPVTIKVITVNSGDSSYTVAKKLEAVGVVSSASSFDAFLCQNGYDKRLRTGNFSIPTDASDEQIARIVTGLE